MSISNRKIRSHPEAGANDLAMLDVGTKLPHSNVTVTSKRGMEDGKEFVEDNKK
jgi:hypothetical protein